MAIHSASIRRLIGLTGPIGSGKSMVAAIWQELGAGVVEGDRMGKLALETDGELRENLAQRFGRQILNADGLVIPSELAKAAFDTEAGRQDLTRLTFPTLYRIAKEHFATVAETKTVVVFDAALIYEWGVAADFDKIVVVTASQDVLLDRVCRRMKISRSAALNRLAAQIPAEEKAHRADIVIVNDGSPEQLRERSLEVWRGEE